MTEDIVKPSRRGFFGLLASVLAAPAIVKATNIMPVRSFSSSGFLTLDDYADRILGPQVNSLYSGDIGGVSKQSLHEITRESVRMFVDTNSFLIDIVKQYQDAFDYTNGSQWGGDVVDNVAGAAAVVTLATKAEVTKRQLFGAPVAALASQAPSVGIAPRIGSTLRIRLPNDFTITTDRVKLRLKDDV